MIEAEAAETIANLVRRVGRRPDLVLEDAAGPFRFLFYFEIPCSEQTTASLVEEGFRHSYRPRTPHDAEADVFVSERLSTGIEFSDPSKNPHTTLWSGTLPPKSAVEVRLDDLLKGDDLP